MIRSSIATRLCTLAAIAASVAGLSVFDAGAQGKASMNGQSCNYSDISIKPNGDLTINCDTGNGGNTAPVCNVTAPSTAIVNQAFSVSASCSPAASSYSWNTDSGATISGSGGTVSIAAPGTYTFAVTGTNAAGTGSAASKSVTVQPETPRTGPPSCTLTASASSVAVNTAVTLTMTCSQTPTVYVWAPSDVSVVTGLTSPSTVNTQTVQFSRTGTYTFWTQAGNPLGGSAVLSANITVTTGTSSGGCPTVPTAVPPTTGYETLGNLRFDLKPGQSGYQSFSLPMDGLTSARLSVIGATKIETPQGTVTETVVAPCAGQFDNIPEGCRVQTLNNSGGNFYIGSISWSSCPLPAGNYFVNIRDTTCAPSPGFSTCSHYIKVNGQ